MTAAETMVIKYSVTDGEIARMRNEYMGLSIAGLQDKKGFDLVHRARIDVKAKRVEVEKTRKDLKADALEFGRAVDAEAKRITALLEPIENYLAQQEDAITEEVERIKREKRLAEEKRLQDRVSSLTAFGAPIDIALLRTMSDEEFDGRMAIVIAEYDKAEAKKKADKAEADRIAAEQAREREQREAEDRARLAEEKKVADEARAKAEAEMAEAQRIKREAEAKQAEAEAKARAAEEEKRLAEVRLQAEKDKALAVERAKAEAEAKAKAEAEEKARKEEIAKREEEERKARIEARRPVREKILSLAAAIEVEALKLPKKAEYALAVATAMDAARNIREIAN